MVILHNNYEVIKMSSKYTNSKKKMASLGLKKNEHGDYTYIDPDDTTSKFIPVRNRNKQDK